MNVPTEILLEAKRRARSLIERGRLISPRDAWLLSGQTRGTETLWSIAFNLAMEADQSPEEINVYLEKQFPNYTNSGTQTYHWDDFQP